MTNPHPMATRRRTFKQQKQRNRTRIVSKKNKKSSRAKSNNTPPEEKKEKTRFQFCLLPPTTRRKKRRNHMEIKSQTSQYDRVARTHNTLSLVSREEIYILNIPKLTGCICYYAARTFYIPPSFTATTAMASGSTCYKSLREFL